MHGLGFVPEFLHLIAANGPPESGVGISPGSFAGRYAITTLGKQTRCA